MLLLACKIMIYCPDAYHSLIRIRNRIHIRAGTPWILRSKSRNSVDFYRAEAGTPWIFTEPEPELHEFLRIQSRNSMDFYGARAGTPWILRSQSRISMDFYEARAGTPWILRSRSRLFNRHRFAMMKSTISFYYSNLRRLYNRLLLWWLVEIQSTSRGIYCSTMNPLRTGDFLVRGGGDFMIP